MEKMPVDKDAPENSTETNQEVESDVLSESTEMTDNTDSTTEVSASDNNPEASQMKTDDTSGIEIVSTSTTSASEVPCEEVAALEIAQPSAVQTERGEMTTSASATRSEGVANLDPEEKTEQPSIQTESVDEQTRSVTSTAEIQSEGTETSSEEKPGTLPIQSETVSSPIDSDSKIPCDQGTADGAVASTEKSPPPKTCIFDRVMKIFSPTKSKKAKESRPKSMSPDKKSSVTKDSNTVPEEARIAAEGAEHVKNESEKGGMMKELKKHIRKFSNKLKSSGTESKSLVTSEAVERAEEPASNSKTENETKDELKQPTLNVPRWTPNRTSLVEAESLGGTTMTDVPSTSSSSVFSDFSSRKASAAGENTSEEAIAASLVCSPDEQIPIVKEDEDTVQESIEDSESKKENEELAAAENTDEGQSSSEDPKNPDTKDEEKPESDN